MTTEQWLPVIGWPYEASDLGHIRRRRKGYRQIRPDVNRDGFQFVTLHSGKRNARFPLDRVIFNTFNRERPEREYEIIHKDGVTWNNWFSNLQWVQEMSDTEWYIGTNATVRRNQFTAGPFASKIDAVQQMHDGQIIVGKDARGTVVSFEILCDKGIHAWPHNPIELARYSRAMADMHSNYFWSLTIRQQANIIEAMAKNTLDAMEKIVPVDQRVRLPPRPMVAREPESYNHATPVVTLPTNYQQPLPRRSLTPAPVSDSLFGSDTQKVVMQRRSLQPM